MDFTSFVFIFFLSIIGMWLLAGYLIIKYGCSVSDKQKNNYFGIFFSGTILAVDGFFISDFAYQLNFWDAPGIWGAPGKESTIWGTLQYILPLVGFAVGILIDKMCTYYWSGRMWQIRMWSALLTAYFVFMTLALFEKNTFQMMG